MSDIEVERLLDRIELQDAELETLERQLERQTQSETAMTDAIAAAAIADNKLGVLRAEHAVLAGRIRHGGGHCCTTAVRGGGIGGGHGTNGGQYAERNFHADAQGEYGAREMRGREGGKGKAFFTLANVILKLALVKSKNSSLSSACALR